MFKYYYKLGERCYHASALKNAETKQGIIMGLFTCHICRYNEEDNRKEKWISCKPMKKRLLNKIFKNN